jgi:hypothetical protein
VTHIWHYQAILHILGKYTTKIQPYAAVVYDGRIQWPFTIVDFKPAKVGLGGIRYFTIFSAFVDWKTIEYKEVSEENVF